MTRPDYVKCIRRSHADHLKESWCGRALESFEWAFEGADHAAESGKNRDRLVACKECVAAVTKALQNGHE